MANLNLHGDVSKNEALLKQAYDDLIVFGKLFSPQDFLASATPNFHVEVGKLLLDKTAQQLALVLPRDHAKSTLAATAMLVYAFWKIEGRIQELERNMILALEEIELHDMERKVAEQAHIQEMQERMEWYEKELNLNPFSWGKSKRKK